VSLQAIWQHFRQFCSTIAALQHYCSKKKSITAAIQHYCSKKVSASNFAAILQHFSISAVKKSITAAIQHYRSKKKFS